MNTTKPQTIVSFLKKHSFWYVNSNITEKNFPAPKTIRTGGKMLELPHMFNNGDEVLAYLKEENLSPGNFYELMAWFDENKDSIKGKRRWYGAFGGVLPVVDGYLKVPALLARSDGTFESHLGSFGYPWYSDYSLLVFGDLDTRTLTSDKSSDPLTLPEKLVINGQTYKKV